MSKLQLTGLLLAFSLIFGCGGSEPAPTSPSTNPPENPSEPSEPATPETDQVTPEEPSEPEATEPSPNSEFDVPPDLSLNPAAEPEKPAETGSEFELPPAQSDK